MKSVSYWAWSDLGLILLSPNLFLNPFWHVAHTFAVALCGAQNSGNDWISIHILSISQRVLWHICLTISTNNCPNGFIPYPLTFKRYITWMVASYTPWNLKLYHENLDSFETCEVSLCPFPDLSKSFQTHKSPSIAVSWNYRACPSVNPVIPINLRITMVLHSLIFLK